MSLGAAGPAQVRWAAARLIGEERRAFGCVLLLTTAATGAGLAGPWLLGRMIDVVRSGGDGPAIDRLASLLVVAATVQFGLVRWSRLVGARFGERLAARVRERFVERVLDLPASVVDRVGTGDLVTRGVGDVAAVSTTLRDAGPEISVAALQSVLILIAVIVLSPVLGGCAVAGLLGMVLISRWYVGRAREAYLGIGATNSELAEVVATTASGARTVEALGLADARERASLDAIAAAALARESALALRSRLFPTLDVAALVPLVAVLLVGAALVGRQSISVGAVITAAVYLRQLGGPLDVLKLWIDRLQSGAASFARLEAVATEPAPRDGRGSPADQRLRVRGVHYSYGAGDVLHGVDLDVTAGERVAVVGTSGAGKTTLVRLLAGLDAPRRGSVTVGGVPVAGLAPDQLRRHVVLVTQEPHVFRGTLRDNLLIAAPSASDEDLVGALVAVGGDWVSDLSGEPWLSAAQAQQVALARVVLADPHTVVLDEATAMLDPRAARSTERALAAVLAGRSVIAVAHRLHTAHDADRVVVMDAGRVAEVGPHEELLAAGGVYAGLWRAWHGPGS